MEFGLLSEGSLCWRVRSTWRPLLAMRFMLGGRSLRSRSWCTTRPLAAAVASWIFEGGRRPQLLQHRNLLSKEMRAAWTSGLRQLRLSSHRRQCHRSLKPLRRDRLYQSLQWLQRLLPSRPTSRCQTTQSWRQRSTQLYEKRCKEMMTELMKVGIQAPMEYVQSQTRMPLGIDVLETSWRRRRHASAASASPRGGCWTTSQHRFGND